MTDNKNLRKRAVIVPNWQSVVADVFFSEVQALRYLDTKSSIVYAMRKLGRSENYHAPKLWINSTHSCLSADKKFNTSHASFAYRKQLPPQRTVGTIGSVWQESTLSKETTGPAQTNTQGTKDHQEGHPLDSNQLTTCEGRPT